VVASTATVAKQPITLTRVCRCIECEKAMADATAYETLLESRGGGDVAMAVAGTRDTRLNARCP
jgi:hypothetical protein